MSVKRNRWIRYERIRDAVILLIAGFVTAALAHAWWVGVRSHVVVNSSGMVKSAPSAPSGVPPADWWGLAGLLIAGTAYFLIDPRLRSLGARRWNCIVCSFGAGVAAVSSLLSRDWFLGSVMVLLCLLAALRFKQGLRERAATAYTNS